MKMVEEHNWNFSYKVIFQCHFMECSMLFTSVYSTKYSVRLHSGSAREVKFSVNKARGPEPCFTNNFLKGLSRHLTLRRVTFAFINMVKWQGNSKLWTIDYSFELQKVSTSKCWAFNLLGVFLRPGCIAHGWWFVVTTCLCNYFCRPTVACPG